METRKQPSEPQSAGRMVTAFMGSVQRTVMQNQALGINAIPSPQLKNFEVATSIDLNRDQRKKKKKWGTAKGARPKYYRFLLEVKWTYPFKADGTPKRKLFESFDYENHRNNGIVTRVYSEELGLKKQMDWIRTLNPMQYTEIVLRCTLNTDTSKKEHKHVVYVIRKGEVVHQVIVPRFGVKGHPGKMNIEQTLIASREFAEKKEKAKQAMEAMMVHSK